MLAPWKKSYDQLRQHIKKRRHYLASKGLSSQSYGFSSSHVWMWELDCEESWAPKNWCFWTVVLEKTLESPLDCKKIQQVHPKWKQSWIFIGKTDAVAETPILWPPDVKNWLIWKDPDFGKDWRQEEKGTTEDEMVGWHHRLNGHEFGWTLSWWWTERPGMLHFCGVTKSWTWLSDWTELNWTVSEAHRKAYLQIKKLGCSRSLRSLQVASWAEGVVSSFFEVLRFTAAYMWTLKHWLVRSGMVPSCLFTTLVILLVVENSNCLH